MNEYSQFGYEKKHMWILKLKTVMLRFKYERKIQKDVAIENKKMDEFSFYDMFYGPRTLKSRKKFEQFKAFKEK